MPLKPFCKKFKKEANGKALQTLSNGVIISHLKILLNEEASLQNAFRAF